MLPRKISSFLLPVRDDHGLKTMGVYSFLCEYSQVHTAYTGWSIKITAKEEQQADKSAVTEHNLSMEHCI
jgi:hypothetical protein